MLSALSGGVDSAVATALLVEAGYDVIAISMLLAGSAEGHAGSCCSIDDFQDARRVAEQLDIPYYVLNLKDAFQTRVIDVFTREYQRGRTPSLLTATQRKSVRQLGQRLALHHER